MSLRVMKTQEEMKRGRIYNTFVNLLSLPKVSIDRIDNDKVFEIKHEQEFVPNFRFEWCSGKSHYRVYILIASREYKKRNVGYPICTIGSGFAAMGFGVVYGFLHKHRANNKEEAYSNVA